MATYYENYDVVTGHKNVAGGIGWHVNRKANSQLSELAKNDGLDLGKELEKIIDRAYDTWMRSKERAEPMKLSYSYDIPDDKYGMLEILSVDMGISIGEIIGMAIDHYYEYRKDEWARVEREKSELIDRLKEVNAQQALQEQINEWRKKWGV